MAYGCADLDHRRHAHATVGCRVERPEMGRVAAETSICIAVGARLASHVAQRARQPVFVGAQSILAHGTRVEHEGQETDLADSGGLTQLAMRHAAATEATETAVVVGPKRIAAESVDQNERRFTNRT